MYSPCQLRIRIAFHTEQGKIAPHINFSVCCQQGILLPPELSFQISVFASELPELAQVLISKKHVFRPIEMSCFSLLQSSACRSQFSSLSSQIWLRS